MRARKRFGQHFLEPAWVRKLVEAIAPGPDDVFLEIGPGHGALTRPLAERARSVLAIEIDRDLVAELSSRSPANATVVSADILEADVAGLLPPLDEAPLVRVAGNLPYNISSPILFRLLELQATTGRLRDATLMLQREVVDRIVAGPGSGEYGPLAVLVGWRARASRLLTLPPGAFRPPPRVTSAVVRLEFLPLTEVAPAPALFEPMVRALFTRRRKTVANALRPFAESIGVDPSTALRDAGVRPGARPETLEIAELRRLAQAVQGLARMTHSADSVRTLDGGRSETRG